jgi:uncharacterized protein (DUF2384 family)
MGLNSTENASKQRREVAAALRRRTLHYEKCMKLLDRLDDEVLAAGMELFEDEAALASWLTQPARALGEAIPLRVMRSASGRKQVASILRAIAHGVYL